MNEITIDCAAITCREDMHRALAAALNFPDWYGSNLDALFDCLTDIGSPTRLTLTNCPQPGCWFDGFRQTLTDATEENPDFTLLMQ